jgi:hypothetical protein
MVLDIVVGTNDVGRLQSYQAPWGSVTAEQFWGQTHPHREASPGVQSSLHAVVSRDIPSATSAAATRRRARLLERAKVQAPERRFVSLVLNTVHLVVGFVAVAANQHGRRLTARVDQPA